MAKDQINPPFSNGFWTWDDTLNGLAFITREEQVTGAPISVQSAKKDTAGYIKFKDMIDNLGMMQFRRQYQRRIKPNQAQIVTIQDVKDVAIFSAERQDLSPEFISFLHTRRMDEFLRTLIVYFQYYFQVWDNLILRRVEAQRKLRQPIVTINENRIRDNLADLRSMVARNYSYILLGFEDTFKYYHMSNRNNVSLSDKDRHLHECLLSIAARIVWIALLRKNFNIIELELNRLFRSQIFNLMSRFKLSSFKPNVEENRVLLGKAHVFERKLKHRSPAIQELIFDHHNYKMLAISQMKADEKDARIVYLETAYTAPEELLFKLKIGVGILGLSKDFLNPILKPKEGMAKRIKIPPFVLPEPKARDEAMVGETLPKRVPPYFETEQAKVERIFQCKVWRRYTAGLSMGTEDATSLMESVLSDVASDKNESVH